jgi:branched-chain amino acid aminotransferase
MEVECRPIPVEELAEVDEAAECGTAAVCTPLSEIFDEGANHTYVLTTDGKPGPMVTKLYNALRDIQYGRAEDKHNWNTIIEFDK